MRWLVLPVLLIAAPGAWADIPSSERWLASDRIAAGLAADGSLGNDSIELALRGDPDGAEGPSPMGGDLLWVGRIFEAWSLEWAEGSCASSAPDGASGVVLDWEEPGLSSTMAWLRGRGATASFEVVLTAQAPWDEPWLRLHVQITAIEDLEDLRVARVVDPDQDYWMSGGYSTANTAGSGWAMAVGESEGRVLALAAPDGEGGICGWCTLPSELEASSTTEATGDHQIGIWAALGDLAAGETVGISFAYALGLDESGAVALAQAAAASDDHDGDGYSIEEGDCDDLEPLVSPAQDERADGLDNDCDGEVDEGTAVSDDDGDGFSEAEGDCDDQEPAVYPGAEPAVGVSDADCDGHADTGLWPTELPEDEVVSWSETEELGRCASAPGPRGAVWLLALLLLPLGRRRGGEP
jgi:hypothetical protein